MPQVGNTASQIGKIQLLIAVRRFFQVLLYFSIADLFIDLEHAHANDLSRQGILYKKDQAIHLSHSGSFMGQVNNFYGYNFILI